MREPVHVERLLESVDRRQTTVLTGPRGCGKSHLLRLVHTSLARVGRNAPLIVGSAPGSRVPLGAFAGVTDLPAAALASPAAVVDAFARDRAEGVLLVDDVELLDEASLYVVSHLISATRIPAVLTVRDLASAPPSIRHLYDGGHVEEVPVEPLSDADAERLLRDLVEGDVTPRARIELLAAARGNPLHLREIVRGSLHHRRLVDTPLGWELIGAPVATPRLSEIVGERFSGLSAAHREAATVVALAGEYPADAISEDDRTALARADVIEATDCGWVRLSHPLDATYLTSLCSTALQHELAHRAIAVLRGDDAASRADSRRRSDVLALEYGCAFDIAAMTELADHALGAFDERLALRAATAVLEIAPDAVQPRRIAGLAASALGDASLADLHLDAVHELAQTDRDRTSVALARAQHLGLAHHDAAAALEVIGDALGVVTADDEIVHLRHARLRWASVAGTTHADPSPHAVAAASDVRSPEEVLSLITAGVSGVIAGPLEETWAILPTLRNLPAEVVALSPGADALIELTGIMALSYTGDVVATRERLSQVGASARERSPESRGIWEYAHGFLEFLAADAEDAYSLGRSAASHLTWRDSAGLLPAARALTAAAALATGRSVEARRELAGIPAPADADPKVVMLRGWGEAWTANVERRGDQAASILLETSQRLMAARHTYLAGMVAHCVVRMARRVDEAAALLESTAHSAGGGLLNLFARHATAVAADDIEEAEAIAAEADDLGLFSTATDTRLWLSNIADRRTMPEIRARRNRLAADDRMRRSPGMALWQSDATRSTLLTEREHRVVHLAADRLTAREIADIHEVSVHTVTNQLASAFRKLGVGSRAELRDLLARDTRA